MFLCATYKLHTNCRKVFTSYQPKVIDLFSENRKIFNFFEITLVTLITLVYFCNFSFLIGRSRNWRGIFCLVKNLRRRRNFREHLSIIMSHATTHTKQTSANKKRKADPAEVANQPATKKQA